MICDECLRPKATHEWGTMDPDDPRGEDVCFGSGANCEHGRRDIEDGIGPALRDVSAFHEACSEVYPEGANCTGRPGLTRRLARLKWIDEEVRELHDAVEAGDVVEAVDALLDIIYFCLGTLVMSA